VDRIAAGSEEERVVHYDRKFLDPSLYCTVGPIDLFRGVGESNVIPLRSFDIDRKLPIFSDIPITHSVFFTQPQVLVRNDGEMKEIEGRQEI
jgi:hypothetical protein